MKRVLTVMVLVPVVVYLVLWAPEWALIAALAIVGVLAFVEYSRIVGRAVSPALLAGVVYVFAPLLVAVALREWNRHWLMFTLLLSWAGDTVAMYVGKSIGKHKLAPVISPNKTWEGAIGSVAGSLVFGATYAHYFIPAVSLELVLLVAAIGNIAGQLGDLFESWLKRRANIKDSGSSLPGHGGWLDRIDAMLFTMPVVYGLLCVFVPRVWLIID
jgi:phosphatidate cytidylyltransferase